MQWNWKGISSSPVQGSMWKDYSEPVPHQRRPGQSDFVCASNISIGDAFTRIQKLQEALNITEEIDDKSIISTSENADEQLPLNENIVLHQAAGILRTHMNKIQFDNKFFFTSDDLTLECATKYVPSVVYTFFDWCVNCNSYDDGSVQKRNT